MKGRERGCEFHSSPGKSDTTRILGFVDAGLRKQQPESSSIRARQNLCSEKNPATAAWVKGSEL